MANRGTQHTFETSKSKSKNSPQKIRGYNFAIAHEMLCRKFKNILIKNPTYSNVIYRPLVQTRAYSKWFDFVSVNMASTVRLKVFKDLFLNRLFNAWTRNYMVNSVFKKSRTERGMKEVFLYFRQVLFRPRTQLLVTVTAAYKNTEEKPGPPKSCSRDIKDKEMRRLIKDLARVEDLSRNTLYCEGCDKRIIIDSKQSGVQYCACPNSKPPVGIFDGWVPYMEAQDIIIWRKEYKPGGLFAYKVYGRYKHIKAEDFAMIQVDGAYRKKWDTAVASISIVERETNGIKDQCVLHWEVLWPRLFANRDYVYLRRHKEFNVKSRCYVHKDGIFPGEERCQTEKKPSQKSSVHAHAKQVSLENEEKERQQQTPKDQSELKDNKAYVIVSRSCIHPNVPETRNAIRVMEYWSHMVITTLNGPDRPGMEFVLTYYDEPAVGGLPTAVTSWAMGRAGPAFLERMRQAAEEYSGWRATHTQDTPDFEPFGTSNVSYDRTEDLNEEDMDSFNEGPDLGSSRRDESTQTKRVIITPVDDEPGDGPQVKIYEPKVVQPDESIILTIEPLKDNMEPTMEPAYDKLKQDALIRQREKKDIEDFETEKPIDTCDAIETIVSPNIIDNIDEIQQEDEEIDKLQSLLQNVEHSETPVDKITANLILPERDEERDADSGLGESERGSDSEEDVKWWRYLYPLYYFV